MDIFFTYNPGVKIMNTDVGHLCLSAGVIRAIVLPVVSKYLLEQSLSPAGALVSHI